MLTKKFWQSAIERAIRTGATSAIGVFGAGNLFDVDAGKAGIGIVGTAVVLDLLTSLTAASPIVPGDGPSLTTAEQVAPSAPQESSPEV